jgi:4-hydroxy-tetrahydrodipicolinate synthase
MLSDSIDMIFEQGNPAGIKEVFALLGISENVVRLPLVTVNEDLSNRLLSFVKKMVKNG